MTERIPHRWQGVEFFWYSAIVDFVAIHMLIRSTHNPLVDQRTQVDKTAIKTDIVFVNFYRFGEGKFKMRRADAYR
jgi:hypothetical protein